MSADLFLSEQAEAYLAEQAEAFRGSPLASALGVLLAEHRRLRGLEGRLAPCGMAVLMGLNRWANEMLRKPGSIADRAYNDALLDLKGKIRDVLLEESKKEMGL